ncbi:STAS domain-containing protein [Actinacidiphila acididurans]|uniref:STAS domain-containing protein n=1 Tax=Actinacidiphila acididurans TaxID=2784346 RepID=UPI0027DD8F4A|nr:STAS domain-containing protein [Actinacidiphila acididurans]
MTRAERDGWVVVTVAGEMDLISSPAVRQNVHDAVAEGRRQVVLDLAGVRFCDSSGVGVMIGARRLMRSCAGRLRIVLPQDAPGAPRLGAGASAGGEAHVNRVLAALGVRRLFEVYPDLTAATDDSARPLSA